MLALPYGGLVVAAGTATQALTTTAGKMTAWTAASQGDSNTIDGDPAVKVDLTNNRILVNAGAGAQGAIYKVDFNLSFLLSSGTSGNDVIATLRKNLVAQTDLQGKANATTAVRATLSFSGFLKVLATDEPSPGIATMAAPSGTFTGASGAPTTEVILDIVLAMSTGSTTITIEQANFNCMRVG